MKKVEIKYDNSFIKDYIKEIQSQLPSYEVNEFNVNEFAKMLEEKKNCSECKGIDSCNNMVQGFCTNYSENEFCFKECKYKKNIRIENSRNNIIKTLYLPDNILNAKLEDFDTNCESRKKIYSSIITFVDDYKNNNKTKGLYLFGTFSIGKTFALSCIANELARNNISCLLIYFPDLVVDLKNAMGTPRLEQLLNMLKSIDVLMLDDLGSENMTQWLRDEVLGPVLNYRVLQNKAVFISSNISPNELQSHFAIDQSPANVLKAKRIISRLQALVLSISMDDSTKYKR